MRRIFNIYRRAYSGLPRGVWLLALVMLVNRGGSMVLFFITLYLTQEMAYSVAAAGQLVSLYGLGSLAGAFLGGWLSDRWGAKWVQIASLALSGIGFIILAYLTTPLQIGAMLFLVALVGEALRPANSTAVARHCPPEQRARGFGLNRLAVNLGVTVGPALGGFLATIDYHYLFWVDGLTCIAAAILLAYFFHGEDDRVDAPHPDVKKATRSPWRDRPFLVLLLLLMSCGLVFNQLFNTWPVYLRETYQLLENRIGLLMAMNAFLVVLIEMPLLHRLEGAHPLRMITLGAIFLFGGFAILPLGTGIGYIAFTVVIWTIGEMLVFPIVASLIANRAADHNRGQYMGMFTFAFALAFVIGPLLGTWIYDHVGANMLWYSCGGLGLLATLGFLGLKPFYRTQ